MKLILIVFLFISFAAKAQVFKSPADAKVSAANADSALFIPANMPKPVWRTTVAKENIVGVQLMLTKTDGSIIIIDSAWKMNIRKDKDKIAVIYPDSSRVIYKVVDKTVANKEITIPFTISKKTFDEAQTIKLEIIR